MKYNHAGECIEIKHQWKKTSRKDKDPFLSCLISYHLAYFWLLCAVLLIRLVLPTLLFANEKHAFQRLSRVLKFINFSLGSLQKISNMPLVHSERTSVLYFAVIV